jgi:quercetin dioxygenase-like cupin family protein
MEHSPIRPTAKAPAQRFKGDVYVTSFATPSGPSRLVASLVRFTPGARTNWHSHDVGQTLHGAEGSGFVGTRDGTVVRIRSGETVHLAPGEEHWHGAQQDTLMAHYALLEVNEDGSDPTTWKEPVTDEQYRAAHEAAEQ